MDQIPRGYYILPVFLFATVILGFGADAIVVQTKIGKIRGLEETTSSRQTKYYAFKGLY